MEISRGSLIVINVLIVIGLIVVVGVITWMVIGVNLDVSDEERQAQFIRLMASTDAYVGRLGFYGGVCSDIGVPPGFLCNDTEQAFALAFPLDSGAFQCGDSTGFQGVIEVPLQTRTTCQLR